MVANHPDADLSSAYKYLAYVYNDKLEYQKALDNFSKVPDNLFDTEDYIKLAQIYLNLKDNDNAFKSLNDAIRSDSTNDEIFYQIGVAQFNQKNYEKAIVNFDKSIAMGSRQIAAYVYKGLCFYSLQAYEDAINVFNTVNGIDNSYFQSWLWKARSEEALNKIDDAKASYKRALEIDPGNKSAQDDLNRLEQKQ